MRPFAPRYEPLDSPFFVCILILAFHSTFLFYFSYCSVSPFAFLRFCTLGHIYPCTHAHMYTRQTHTEYNIHFILHLARTPEARVFLPDLRTLAQPHNLPSHFRSCLEPDRSIAHPHALASAVVLFCFVLGAASVSECGK